VLILFSDLYVSQISVQACHRRSCGTFSGGVILQGLSTGDTPGAALFRSRPQSRIVGFRITPGALKTKNRRPYIRWAVGASNWRAMVTRTRESHPRLNLRLDGALASPPPGCRVRLRTAFDADRKGIAPEEVKPQVVLAFRSQRKL
jgi:hypothetical protein